MRCRPNRRRRHSGVDGDGAGRPARRFKRRRAVLTAGYSSWKERSGLPPGGSNVAVRSSTAGWWPSRSSTSARADHCAPGARVPWRRHQQATLGQAAQRSRLKCLTPATSRRTVVLVLNTTPTHHWRVLNIRCSWHHHPVLMAPSNGGRHRPPAAFLYCAVQIRCRSENALGGRHYP